MLSPSHVFKIPLKLPRLATDRVIILMALIILALFAVNSTQAMESLIFVVKSLVHIAPFFLFAILFAAYAKASGFDQLIARAFSGKTGTAIVAGSLAGALSPFCSCGVIPVIAAMLAAGVPLAPVMAFCIASPIMNPEMFILTAAGITLEFALVKTAAALGMGLLAGFSIQGLQKLGYLRHQVKATGCCACSQPSLNQSLTPKISWRFWPDPHRKEAFMSSIRNNGFFLGKWMAFAFLLESLMIASIPAESVAGLVGMDNPMAIPLSALIGIPAYMNGYAAIPLVSGLLEMGMAPGAALTFVTAGAVSSIPAALAVYALVKRAVFLVYILLGIIGSVTAGYLYQLLLLFS